ncbi:MAG: hypothetical protein KDD63_03365, partial [Bacteroidetes bacterium]|nr:hypothetical protein [Bacteroidota bacterium]
ILANDISASNGSVTYSGCDGADSAVVSIDITNNGTNPATGIIAAFSVDGGPLTTPEFVPGILAPGAMITYTFTATADVSAPGPHTVAAGAAILTDQDTTNNVDIIAVFNSTLAAPFLEDFEGGTVGSPGVFPPGWSIASSSTASPASAGWHVESDGTTNSSDTGPLDDHTPGGTKYVFTETSSGSLGDVFELFSPCIDLDTVKAPKLSFWYHMYGATMGTLRVDAIAGGVRTALDSLVGQQQTGENEPWREMIIDLGAYEGQVIELVWVGTKGSSFTGDMAVDDINIFQPPASDLKVVGTNMGSSNCGLDSATVITVDVQNFGSDTIQSG